MIIISYNRVFAFSSKYLQNDPAKPSQLSFDRCRFNESSCYTSEHSEQFIIAVYNHLAWEVTEAIRIPVMEGNYEVYAPNGDKITSQLVDIPVVVQSIPTRKSGATHEIFFIAKLHPVSYKTFYIRKTNRNKRSAYDVKNPNDYEYWSDVKERAVIDIANLDEAKHGKTVFTPIYESRRNNINVFDDSIIDDDVDRTKEIDQLVQIIQEHKKKKLNQVKLRTAIDDDMKMLGDDPMVVNSYSDNSYLENEHIKLHVSPNGEITRLTRKDGTEIQFAVQFSYYPGALGNNAVPTNRSSGAYIFRPNGTESISLKFNTSEGPSGPVVKELRINVAENVHSTFRLYDGLNFLETEWVVGPIDVSDDIGKEFVVKYLTDLANNGEFYTDSNGRQAMKRKLNMRPQWDLTVEEPIAGNYYPITNKIYINDEKHKFAVLTDRAQGGTSLSEGEVEIMLHRRLLHDDAFGVGEALNEEANGKGLVVRGRHRLFLSEAESKVDCMEEKKQVLQFHLQPIVLIADATKFSLQDWLQLPSKAFSWANSLPKGVHLLTVEPWGKKSLLLRLENYLEIGDQENTTVEVNLDAIFKGLTVKRASETMLAANLWVDEKRKWSWNKENGFSVNFNEEYGELNNVEKSNDEDEDIHDDGLLIRLKAKQIKTYVVDFNYN
ncbi:lysosomal alpha-mannosidase-like [Hyposmocoma kahamanoa]|uniref:lysosomal alpha-mannosidase-like n=1 Tax=Hyposmocoma kahamanoa TaxID=1477025 RepID=UPI000E6D81A3|nr:lysosomal alpha-mannosidase-like [Hyposmocoma kahamanoa]